MELSFTDNGGATRVELEHRGWEIPGDREAVTRETYDSGWAGVLSLFVEHCRGG